MAAYFIAQYTVNNSDLYADYSAGAGPTLAQYGAELVAFDVGAETIAKAWYNSPEYQAIVHKRLEATEGFSVISQSMNAGG